MVNGDSNGVPTVQGLGKERVQFMCEHGGLTADIFVFFKAQANNSEQHEVQRMLIARSAHDGSCTEY